MRIGFVSQPIDGIIPPPQNSIGIWIYEVANRLAESHDVLVYAKRNRSQQRLSEDGKVVYKYIPLMSSRVMFKANNLVSTFQDPRRPFFASGLSYLEYGVQIALDLRKQRCEIVNLSNFTQFIPIIRRFNPDIKIVLRMSCDWLIQLDHKMIERRLREVDLVIGCSDYITNGIRQAFPQFASRCQTVHNGRDVELFVPANGHDIKNDDLDKRLLFVGRVSPEKGVHILLEAFSDVVKNYPELTLDIVGSNKQLERGYLISLSDGDRVSGLDKYYDGVSDFSYYAYLQDLVKSLGIASRVRFIGQVPHKELRRRYRDATIFIFPSIWDEPSGNPPIEAMAAGIPVISTRTGGTAEYVEDGVTGLLVDSGDVGALAKAIIQILTSDEQRASMGKAGRERAVELFSYERLIENLLDIYNRLQANKNQANSYRDGD